MFKLLLSLIFILVSDAHAGIFGTDDRVDTKDSSLQNQKLGRSVPALIDRSYLRASGDRFEFAGMPLAKVGLCSSERFAEEAQVANCSGSLIHKKYVLTAAHCLDEYRPCDEYFIAFDYVKGSRSLSRNQVYECKRIVYHKFDMMGLDLAVIELDREVKDRSPVKLDLNFKPITNTALTMIGYPYGVSQKVTGNGSILGIQSGTVHSFMHNLDTFSVNSGGPIFNQNGEQVAVLVRSTTQNFADDIQNCKLWGKAQSTDFAEANTLGTLKKLLHTFKD